jgi:hypothetical protein
LDSKRPEDARLLAGGIEFRWLEVRYPEGAPEVKGPSARLAIVIEVDGRPAAELRLLDILRRGGIARIRVLYTPGEHLRVLLMDGDGVWENAAPEIEVLLT